ncbi:MAG TPA: serine/threonine-protein kinase, partial [Ktedonobacteraceae bacterium]
MSSDDNITQFGTKRTLGRYQLLQRIGRGGMGEVWLSDDPRLLRKVAIKTLPPHSRNDAEFSARFEREAQATAALNHPHILPIHDYGEELLPNGKTVNYIVMPYIEGGSLAGYIDGLADQHIGISQQEAIHILAQMAEAIDYAHQQGLIHRDIKPGNMLMRSRDWLLLTDFGIARVLNDNHNHTQTNIPAGTAEYMAPEQARGHAEASSDIYSLAVIAYQFVTGRLPFSAETHYATIIQHMTMEPPPPSQFNPYISPELEQVLLRGLAKRPAERYASARDFVNDIRAKAFLGATPPPLPQQR